MNPYQTRDRAAGERRKTDALVTLAERRETCVNRGRRALLSAMLDGDGRASADDVYAAVELPSGMDPCCLGSVPGALAYQRIIRPTGFVRSTRPERHACWIQVWELVDRAAAERWLTEHPELLDRAAAGQDRGEQGFLFPMNTNEPTPTGTAAGAGREE